jgi:hypothetical protein
LALKHLQKYLTPNAKCDTFGNMEKPLKTYNIMNEFDPNDTFEIEAEDENDAAHKALEALGFWVSQISEL